MIRINNKKIERFDWDTGNREKNVIKHQVRQRECEEVFFNQPLLIKEVVSHSQKEKRLYVLGKTNHERLLFISFTVRDNNIRVISARDQSKKERKIYENFSKKLLII